MGKIIFYEDRNFGSRYHECMGDCADLHSYFNLCHSVKVESGYFMVYDRPSYMGCQYFLKRGEYPDYMCMMGMNDCIRSCRMIPMHHGTFRMRLYERFHMSDFQSCQVMDEWLAYKQPNYMGRHFYLRPGEYRRYSDWGGMSSRMGSIRQIRDL
ncbi:LOW QUALITY PROTEIN: crystallin, gamma M7 [Triplophysa rosa]|uniref:LOW QUALITY PROTEIN: crystallin, gamma M7 n=1 Tax=Triplophysa rosa TaxID=992332 RepID=UPI002545BFE5|nr:LOW QUALITY PROTEIN: crystallin, gamma M7 [Triplophysa rosa]